MTLPDTQTTSSSNVRTPEAQEDQASKEKEPITSEAQMINLVSQIDQLDESIPLQEIVTIRQISHPNTKENF